MIKLIFKEMECTMVHLLMNNSTLNERFIMTQNPTSVIKLSKNSNGRGPSQIQFQIFILNETSSDDLLMRHMSTRLYIPYTPKCPL